MSSLVAASLALLILAVPETTLAQADRPTQTQAIVSCVVVGGDRGPGWQGA